MLDVLIFIGSMFNVFGMVTKLVPLPILFVVSFVIYQYQLQIIDSKRNNLTFMGRVYTIISSVTMSYTVFMMLK